MPFPVLFLFSEGLTGNLFLAMVSHAFRHQRLRYEREAWDLFGIFFENHPDLYVLFRPGKFVPLMSV